MANNTHVLATEENDQLNAIKSVQATPKQLISKKTVFLADEKPEHVVSFTRLTITMLTIMSGSFNLGYSISYLSLAYDTLFAVIELKGTVTEELGLFGALIPIGCLVGSILTYFLMRGTTRRQSILIADLFGMSSILMVIPNREVILTFRFMYGVACGISCIIQPLFVKELCPDKYFGQFSVVPGFAVGTGLLVGNLFGVGFLSMRGADSNWWRVVFAVPAFLSLMRQVVLLVIGNVESPISLIERNRDQEAMVVIKSVYASECVEQVYQKCQLRIEHNKTQKEGILSIFDQKHRKTVSIGVMLMFAYNWCGMQAVFAYSAQLFDDMADNDLTMITVFTVILGISTQITTFISGWLFGNFGRKPLLLLGLLVMALLLIIITILSYIDNPDLNVLVFVVICLSGFVYASTPAPIAWIMIPEINNSDGTYIGILSLWVWQLALLYIFPFMKDGIGLGGTFIVFTAITLLCALYFHITVIETKGLNHNQIEYLFGKRESKQ